ncbi:hypothetical protein BC828DRAFT_400261 [Blastocladiella britannica]|nr:hypothetical protein BC828DRAFT_400261 [Blastocladiella britannica]
MAADGTSSSSFINLPAALPAHIRALFTPIAMAHPDSAILAHMSIFDESAHPTQYQALVDSVADEICAWNETTSGGAATTLFGGQSWSAVRDQCLGLIFRSMARTSSVNPNFSFEPNQQSLKMPYLVVNNLSEITTDADLSTEFAKFGTVALVSLNPTCSRATVGMPNTESAVGAIAALNGRKLKGNIISVEDATDRTHLVQASSLSDHATKYDVERHFSGQLALEQFNGDLHVALLRAHDAKAKQEAIRRFNGTPMSGQAVRVEDFDALNGPAQEQQQQQQQQQHQEPPKKGQWWRPLAVTGLGVLSVALVGPVLAVGAVQALGFGAGGIVAGSAAAGMMSGAGTVAAGSGIALLQSVGATGTLLWSGSAMAATAGVAAAAGAAAAAASGDGEEEKKEEEKKEEEKKEEEKKEE